MKKLLKPFNAQLLLSELKYCSDNAAMIGRYALDAYEKKQFIDPNEIDIVSTKKHQAGMLL